MCSHFGFGLALRWHKVARCRHSRSSTLPSPSCPKVRPVQKTIKWIVGCPLVGRGARRLECVAYMKTRFECIRVPEIGYVGGIWGEFHLARYPTFLRSAGINFLLLAHHLHHSNKATNPLTLSLSSIGTYLHKASPYQYQDERQIPSCITYHARRIKRRATTPKSTLQHLR